jgi:hypothetical protein
MGKNIVVVDIDGTLSRPGERLKYIKQEPKDWDAFYEDCFEDEPIYPILELVVRLEKAGYLILFCTGRRECCRKKTEFWFYQNMRELCDHTLLMRKDGDEREDTEVKPELLHDLFNRSLMTKDDVALILEDRSSMVKKWRELGYTCLQVAEGDF